MLPAMSQHHGTDADRIERGSTATDVAMDIYLWCGWERRDRRPHWNEAFADRRMNILFRYEL